MKTIIAALLSVLLIATLSADDGRLFIANGQGYTTQVAILADAISGTSWDFGVRCQVGPCYGLLIPAGGASVASVATSAPFSLVTAPASGSASSQISFNAGQTWFSVPVLHPFTRASARVGALVNNEQQAAFLVAIASESTNLMLAVYGADGSLIGTQYVSARGGELIFAQIATRFDAGSLTVSQSCGGVGPCSAATSVYGFVTDGPITGGTAPVYQLGAAQ